MLINRSSVLLAEPSVLNVFLGHISKMIGSKDSTVYELYNVKTRNTGCPPITVNVSIADTVIKLEVDTGASATLITRKVL